MIAFPMTFGGCNTYEKSRARIRSSSIQQIEHAISVGEKLEPSRKCGDGTKVSTRLDDLRFELANKKRKAHD